MEGNHKAYLNASEGCFQILKIGKRRGTFALSVYIFLLGIFFSCILEMIQMVIAVNSH